MTLQATPPVEFAQLEWREMANDDRYVIRDMAIDSFTLSETQLRAGQSTRGHAHPWPEVYMGTAGSGTLYLDGDEGHPLVPGSRYIVPGNVHHRVSTETGVTFTCVFEGPRR